LIIDDRNVLVDPEKSWLISYDSQQLKWAEDYLEEGTCDENELNQHNGIIAVKKVQRNNKLIETTDFQLGGQVIDFNQ